jgi:hypothetical protein
MPDVRKIKLELAALDLRTLEGEGESVAFNFVAERVTKGGTPERYEIRLKVCRYSITVLLQQVGKMHARDRLRILEEGRRIDREKNILSGS